MIKGTKARQIILDSNLEEGNLPKHLELAIASKTDRRSLIRKLPDTTEGRAAAAIEIQRFFRGYCTRCRLFNTVDPVISNTAIYSNSKHHLSRLHDVRTPSPTKSAISQKSSKSSGRLRLEAHYQNYLDRMRRAGHKMVPSQILSFEDFCAKYIQDWWGTTKSGKYAHRNSKHKAPKPIQKREGPLQSSEAATIIQRTWRRHIDVQVYRYYKELINFKNRGDPAMMLKCINPNEAKMLDAASGIHIKFRLAGDKFPPNIYYKIYTHRPVQDLCANSPKDYTRPDAKRKMAKDIHNRGNRVPRYDNVGWYQRIENNGWRLVSDRLFHHIMSDPITWETSYKKVDFHHNKLQRKQDLEKKKKNKKIEWMKKLYKDGMLRAKADDDKTIDLIEGAAAGMIATVDAYGPAAVQDWEVDELLDWTTSLNFDDYWSGWKEIATSSVSEKAIVDRIKMYTDASSDPFELRVTQGYQRGTSTRPSFNTPESTPSMASGNYNRH